MKCEVTVTQSCPTLCNPMDCIHESLQARILQWVAFPFSKGSSQPSESRSPTLQVDSLPANPQGKPHGAYYLFWYKQLPFREKKGCLYIYLLYCTGYNVQHCAEGE